MNTTTLRGVFPEPKPVHKRNFIRENVRHVKQMQGILQNASLFDAKTSQSKPRKLVMQHRPPSSSSTTNHQILSQVRSVPISRHQNVRRKVTGLEKSKSIEEELNPELNLVEEPIEKQMDQAIQTEKPENIEKLYENGTIKYPSPAVVKMLESKHYSSARKRESRKLVQSNSCNQAQGDTDGGIIVPNPHNKDISDNMQALDIGEEKNFIKENIMALKQKAPKSDGNNQNLLQNYQKGVLPKYLRERREEQKKELEEGDTECPDGHVLLPDEERKETLRVLRQSYADRIQELNSMPVRNDTLRMRKRKMAIEEELKKIDEGIKVFQRPKVFVKINA